MRQLDTTSNHRDWHFINTDVKLRSLPESSPIPLSGLDGEKEGIDALGNYSADPRGTHEHSSKLCSYHGNHSYLIPCSRESRLIDTAGQVDGQSVTDQWRKVISWINKPQWQWSFMQGCKHVNRPETLSP